MFDFFSVEKTLNNLKTILVHRKLLFFYNLIILEKKNNYWMAIGRYEKYMLIQASNKINVSQKINNWSIVVISDVNKRGQVGIGVVVLIAKKLKSSNNPFFKLLENKSAFHII